MILNYSQQKAVESVTGPCLVLAGAGSGKTRVIISKIAYLINKLGYQPSHIAALTFTNKASREMKKRVAQMLDQKNTRGLMISTFHTLGLDIIKNEYIALGIKENFSLFDDQDQLTLLQDITKEWIKNDNYLLQQLITKISNWKNQLINATNAKFTANSKKDKLFAHCYSIYERNMKLCNLLDFDDLILLPILLFQRNIEIRQRWQQKVRYLLVDEYQDTNSSQYELIKLLVHTYRCFTVVGDDDQSIYSWRGARPQNLMLLKEDFPKLKVIKLEQNYRSSERILKVANILISNNSHIFEKKLFSKLEYGTKLSVITGNNENHEAEKVISELINHKLINKTNYNDYAILYRSNHQSRVFEKIMLQNRIPYHISGNTSFFSRPEIKDILAYLRILTNIDDDSAFIRIINTPPRQIGAITLQKLGCWAMQQNKSLFTASFDLGLSQILKGRGLIALQNFTMWLKKIVKLAICEPQTALYNLIKETDYKNFLLESVSNHKTAEIRIKNIDILCKWITDMLSGSDDQEAMTLTQIVKKFTLRDIIERGETKDNLNQVQLMTLHASKGLEFPYVFLVGMEEGLLPHQNSIDEDNIEEERRLTYVGITRAKKDLTFTLCKERRRNGELFKPTPSRFLMELPKEDLEWERVSKVTNLEEERIKKGIKYLANIRAQLKKNKKK